MMNIDNETKEILKKFGTQLEKYRKNQIQKVRGYSRSGEKVKLYAKRHCGVRKSGWFTHSKKSLQAYDWCSEVIETVLGVKLSSTVILRRALIAYQSELIMLLCNNSGSTPADFEKYLTALTMERDIIYECADQELGKEDLN